MPKLKTNRSAAKRFSFTKTGKVKHKRAYLRHLNSSKSRGRKRRLRHAGYLGPTDAKRAHALVPQGRR
jgi:large subunit ribosomal protein L35